MGSENEVNNAEIPDEVMEAARTLEAYFEKTLGSSEWEYLGVCSRKLMQRYRDEIERWRDSNQRFRDEMERQARLSQELRNVMEPFATIGRSLPEAWPDDGIVKFVKDERSSVLYISLYGSDEVLGAPTVAQWRALGNV